MSAEPVRIRDRQTDWLVKALDDTVGAHEALDQRRREVGGDAQSRIKQALAAAKQMRRRKLSKEEKLELAALEAKHVEAQRELGRVLAESCDEAVSGIGLPATLDEVRQANEQLSQLRRDYHNAKHRWVPFTSLPKQRQKQLVAAAGLLTFMVFGSLLFVFPEPLKGVYRTLVRNESINTALLALSPPVVPGFGIEIEPASESIHPGDKVQLTAKLVNMERVSPSSVEIEWQVEDDEGIRKLGQGAAVVYTAPPIIASDRMPVIVTATASHPADVEAAARAEFAVRSRSRIERWPLARPDFQLAWEIAGSLRALGFVEKKLDPERVLFFPADSFATGQTRILGAGQFEPIDPHSADTVLERYPFVGRVVYKAIDKLSIPSGTCLADTSSGGEAPISLRSGEHVDVGTSLHVVRRIEEPNTRGEMTVRWEVIGAVPVVQASRQDCHVHVPPGLELQKQDWVFPHLNRDTDPKLLIREITFVGEAATTKEVRDRQQIECQEIGDMLASAFRDLGITVLDELDRQDPDFELRVTAAATPRNGELELTAFWAALDGREGDEEPRKHEGKLATAFVKLEVERDVDSYPHYFPLGTPLRLTLLEPGFPDVVGYFDDAAYIAKVGQPPRVADIHKRLATEKMLPVRDIIGEAKTIPIEKILPGSLEQIDLNEAEQEPSFIERVAASVMRKTCVRVATVVPLKDGGYAGWFHNEQAVPRANTKLRILRRGTPVVTCQPLSGLAMRLLPDKGVELAPGDLVALDDLPDKEPYVVFARLPGRKDTLESKLNYDVMEALGKVGIRCTDRALNPEELENSARQQSLVDDGITHVFHSECDDDQTRPGHYQVSCWLTSLRVDADSRQISDDRATVGSGSLTLVDILRRRREVPALPPVIGGELYYVKFTSEIITRDDDPTFRQVVGKGHTICQVVHDDGTHYVFRWLPDQSLHRVPKASVEVKRWGDPDLSRMMNPNDLVFVAAFRVVEHLCHAGLVAEADVSAASVAMEGLNAGDRLRVVRPGRPDAKLLLDRLPQPIGLVRVGLLPGRATRAVSVRDDVSIKAGDIVCRHGKDQRIQLMVAPLTLDDEWAPQLKRVWTNRGKEIARELMEEFGRFGIPLSASREELEKIDHAVDVPGLDKAEAATFGLRYGATHVLSGTLAPRTDSKDFVTVRFLLTNVETGQTDVLGETSSKIHVSLGQKFSTPGPKSP